MSKLQIPRDEQIKILRNAASIMRNAINDAANPRFDEDISDIALSIRGSLLNILNDSCLDLIRTDAEMDEVARQMLGDDFFEARA